MKLTDRASTGNATARLTKRVVDGISPQQKRSYVWDAQLKGFGIKIEPTGLKTYIVRYRPKGSGSKAPKRFVSIGRHGPLTPDAARQQATVLLGEVARGKDPVREMNAENSSPTLELLAHSFLSQHIQHKRKPRTLALYDALLKQKVLPVLGKRIAKSVTRAEVERLHLSMITTAVTANRMLSVLSSMYSFGARRGLVPEGLNPARGVGKFRETSRDRYLTNEELERLGWTLREAETLGLPWKFDEGAPKAKHVPKFWKNRREKIEPRACAAIRLLLLTGARVSEILNLEWNQVDFDRGLLFLADSKTGRKTIVLNGVALEVLKGLASRRGPARFVIEGATASTRRVDLKRPWAAVCRDAALEGVRLHDLRHTFASVGAGASLGLPIVGKLLGHSQPATTARYAHLDADPLRRASNVIGEHLRSAMAQPIPGSNDGAK